MQIQTGFNGHFDRHMNPIRQKAKQAWEVGAVVNVGFLKGLTVTAENNADGSYSLRSAKGAEYRFTPHLGIERVN